jgi:hypothetical protein
MLASVYLDAAHGNLDRTRCPHPKSDASIKTYAGDILIVVGSAENIGDFCSREIEKL